MTIDERLKRLEALVVEEFSSTISSFSISVNNKSMEEIITKGDRYIITIAEEISRLLTTPLGSRVMLPEYGSELYKIRDRELNSYWKLKAIEWTFIAINRWIERVKCRKVKFTPQDNSAKVSMVLELEGIDGN